MHCLGITAHWRRCQRPGQRLFCDEHKPQPVIALVSAILSFAIGFGASILASHVFATTNPPELVPSDFDVELVSSCHASMIPAGFHASESLHIQLYVASVRVDATVRIAERGEPWTPSVKNPIRSWHYPSVRRAVHIEKKATLPSLVGQRVSVFVPTRIFPERCAIKLHLWIRGHQITFAPNEEGKAEHVIAAADLGRGG